MKITAVELDPVVYEVAAKHFDLNDDDKLQVVIEDGLNYLKNAVNQGKHKLFYLLAYNF